MARYCAWRDRCTSETIQKLFDMGITGKDAEKIVKWLKEEKYLDDERFAHTFARGKFHNNRWGKIRIAMELKIRKINEATIEDALSEIAESEYLATVEELARKKWNELKDDDTYIKSQKTAASLSRKGYESELIWPVVEKIKSGNPAK